MIKDCTERKMSYLTTLKLEWRWRNGWAKGKPRVTFGKLQDLTYLTLCECGHWCKKWELGGKLIIDGGSLENQPWIFTARNDTEAPILWPPDEKSQLIVKDPDARKDWRQKEKRAAEDEVVRYHHQLTGHEFEQTPGDSEGQESLAWCSPWYCRESDVT